MGKLPYHVWVYVGILLLLLGLQARMVETYILSPQATRTMHDWFGPSPNTPTGALQRMALDSDDMARKHYRPPSWAGYALLSTGAVMFAHGLLQRRR